MQAHLRLGRVLGIPIGLHYSWVVIAVLIALSLAGHFAATNPGWTTAAVWIAAVVTSALFFASIVLHELSHAVVARAYGLPVRSITLFALGGVARIEKESGSAKAEFWMGIAGPVTSVAIGLVCLGLASTMGPLEPAAPTRPAPAVLQWLGYINVLLAGFNLIPGFPLDGGRVLRAGIWWITGDQDRATRAAARIGQGVALVFIAVGFLQLFAGAGLGGLWLALIGWFFLDAAGASYAQVELVERLRDIHVGDVMTRDCVRIDPRMPINQFVEDHLLRSGRRCFIATTADTPVGLITPRDVAAVDRDLWPETRVAEVMRPLDRVATIAPDALAADALTLVSRQDVNQLPIVTDGKVAGVVARSHIIQLLEARAELNI